MIAGKFFWLHPQHPLHPLFVSAWFSMGIFKHLGCRGGILPHTPICHLGVGGCRGHLIPCTQNGNKYPLKIKYLRAQGVGGVEGAGHPAYITTNTYTRIRARVFRRRFSWICNPAGVSIRICNPIIEFLFLTFAAKEILTKVVYLFNRITNSYTHSRQILA